jgi:hypothetical protein
MQECVTHLNNSRLGIWLQFKDPKSICIELFDLKVSLDFEEKSKFPSNINLFKLFSK